MRQPVSSHGGGLGVFGWVVRLAVLPSSPEDAESRAPEDADRVRMPASSCARSPCARAGAEGGGPRGVAGVVGEAGERGAEAAVAGPAEADASGPAGLACDGTEAGVGGEVVGARVAGALLAAPRQRPQAAGIVADLESAGDGDGRLLHHADGARAATVQSCHENHGHVPLSSVALLPVGRTCGTLIIRRSGTTPLAHQPVARSVLPAPAARRVSCGPSRGERPWPSRRGTGSGSLTPSDMSLPEGRVP
jgi:hypothetical protein